MIVEKWPICVLGVESTVKERYEARDLASKPRPSRFWPDPSLHISLSLSTPHTIHKWARSKNAILPHFYLRYLNSDVDVLMSVFPVDSKYAISLPMSLSQNYILTSFPTKCFQISSGYLMVVDLQGVISTDENGVKTLELTDPAIHCTDLTRFGRTNLGLEGMKTFFGRHVCNKFCRAMELKSTVL
ncbi:alpha-kinase family domain-containing protein [Ditylenchus destructor]|uniref:Alpha-kinase family domain-containing protein n=1 Tax=Ditylenchus destructor TaxID=166010 RepID=A0AAD4MLE9_9BILA|nr:alpha-kinase family domain-containing protein [Ditylenchus destructor]